MATFTYSLKNRPDLSDALIVMCPNAPFICNQNPETGEYDYENVEWQTHPDWEPPAKEDVLAYLKTLQDEWDSKVKYRQSRAVSYPTVGEQLDALWHAMDDGLIPKIEPMYSQIKETKENFPKNDPTVDLVLRNDVIEARQQAENESIFSAPPFTKEYDPEGF